MSLTEFIGDSKAFAGTLFIFGFLMLITGRLLNFTKQWRFINKAYETLVGRRISTKFNGPVLTSMSRRDNISVVSAFWSVFTLKTLKDHLFENAVDVFSVVYMAQICTLIIFMNRGAKIPEALIELSEHLPTIEIAAVGLFCYVIWRIGLHWERIKDWCDPKMLSKIEDE